MRWLRSLSLWVVRKFSAVPFREKLLRFGLRDRVKSRLTDVLCDGPR